MPNWMHVGKGAETGAPATMHCFLRRQQPDVETDDQAVKTVIYGPLTSNQVVLLSVVCMYGAEPNERCFQRK